MSESEPHPGDRDWRDPVRVEGPPGQRPPSTHLVVGFDRHNPSHIALDYAIGLAGVIDAHLHVAHVIDADDLPIDPDAADWDRAITEIVERERADACAMLTALPGNWSYHAHRGNPARILTSIADTTNASMIVIGTPRHTLASRVDRLLDGSVSAQLIHHGRHPVLLVPGPTPT